MKKILLITLTAAFVLAGCSSPSQATQTEGTEVEIGSTDSEETIDAASEVEISQNPMLISAEEAYAIMNSEESYVIVDVRTEEEYNEGHIEGALLIPNETITTEQPELLPVLDAKILLYCRSGNRSGQAAVKLVEMGYTNVIDFGGITSWPYETVTTPWEIKAQTLSSFRSTDIYGNPIDETVFAENKLTMINIWGTFCPPCIAEMPDLGEISTEYADSGFKIVGVVLDTTGQGGAIVQSQVVAARELVDETGAGYLHLLPTTDLLASGMNAVFNIPTTIFVDSTGTQVGDAYVGSRAKGEWIAVIDQLLTQVP
ncbi:MAG: rhodanese-like domain-containing protein [Lachnospiraceae bacterium]